MVENEVQWLSIAELRGYFGVSNALVHKWIDKHGMPAHKKGSLWKFNMDEVDEWVKTGGADRLRIYGTE